MAHDAYRRAANFRRLTGWRGKILLYRDDICDLLPLYQGCGVARLNRMFVIVYGGNVG